MKVTFNSPVTLGFALLASLFFFLFEADGTIPRMFVLSGTFNHSEWQWYVSLIGYTMGHVSTAHLLGNMSIILLLGPIIEKRYGSKDFIIMILVTALVTALIHILFWDEGLVGASGIAFMFITLVSLIDIQGKEIPFTFILILCLYVGQEIVASFKQDEISQFAHIVGGIMGTFFGFYFKRGRA